jgi:hypothetical protein
MTTYTAIVPDAHDVFSALAHTTTSDKVRVLAAAHGMVSAGDSVFLHNEDRNRDAEASARFFDSLSVDEEPTEGAYSVVIDLDARQWDWQSVATLDAAINVARTALDVAGAQVGIFPSN